MLYREDYANMGCFKKLKLWWKRHVIPGPSGRVGELEKQLKELVAKQKRLDAHIMKLQTNLRDQIRMTVLGLCCGRKWKKVTIEGRLRRVALKLHLR